jgi:hypothetical protein
MNGVNCPTPSTQAALRARRECLRTSRTRTPRRARMSMSASVLNRSMRPRRKSLIRGWVMCRTFANSAWVRCLASINFWTLIINSARTSRCSASPGANPTSRKTLPLDCVILSFILNLLCCRTFAASLQDQRTKPVSSKVRFSFGSFPSSLLESMQNINTFGKLRHIENSMLKPSVDTDLLHTSTNFGHRLPVIRLKSLLDAAQLEASNASCILWKSLEIALRRSEPEKRLIRHGIICGY